MNNSFLSVLEKQFDRRGSEDLKSKIHEYQKTIITQEYFFSFFDQDKSKIHRTPLKIKVK